MLPYSSTAGRRAANRVWLGIRTVVNTKYIFRCGSTIWSNVSVNTPLLFETLTFLQKAAAWIRLQKATE